MMIIKCGRCGKQIEEGYGGIHESDVDYSCEKCLTEEESSDDNVWYMDFKQNAILNSK